MTENQELLDACALLEEVCKKYSDDREVADFQACIAPVIADVRAGRVTPPIEWREIPCFLYFTEGTLQRFPDVESAFATFQIVLTGGMPDSIREFLEDITKK
jgi:hypothetical protein